MLGVAVEQGRNLCRHDPAATVTGDRDRVGPGGTAGFHDMLSREFRNQTDRRSRPQLGDQEKYG